MEIPQGNWAVSIVLALIGAGGLDFVRGVIKHYREARESETPEGRKATHLGLADKSMLLLERANDVLGRDLEDERKAHAADNARYEKQLQAERARNDELRAELRQVEEQLREALEQLSRIKLRHQITD